LNSSLDLLEKNQSPADPGDVQANAKIIQDTLREFDIEVKMEGANIGPRVTQFQLLPAKGVKMDKITALEKIWLARLRLTAFALKHQSGSKICWY